MLGSLSFLQLGVISLAMLSVAKGLRLSRIIRTGSLGHSSLPKLKFRPPCSCYRPFGTTLLKSTLAEVTSPSSAATQASQFVFVGGKGGVGKTTSSSAIALSCSDAGHRTLIVSTDPAHSLGDALDTNLPMGKITPILTETKLWALEIDVDAVLQEFKDTVEGFDSESIASSLGIPKDIVDSFGLEDVADIFTNPPPGIDEIVALTKIFQYANSDTAAGGESFDRIIIDTAPTGHTLRLLQLPNFLTTLTGKLINFRSKITSAIDSFKSMFGGGQSTDGPSAGDKLKNLLGRLDDLQASVAMVKATLKDKEKTQFVVVTIPTLLAVTESKRLVTSLAAEDIKVSTLLCNQVLAPGADANYMKSRSMGQQQSIELIKSYLNSRPSSSSEEGGAGKVEITEVPYIDTEVTGLYGLKFFHSLAHPPVAKTATNPIDSRKLTIFGGKGGVGKTTSAASWAVRLSDSGFRTLVVSSDPAHSLGDAFQETLTGKPRLLDESAEGGSLWAMEIDPQQALEEFRDLLQSQTAQTSAAGAGARGGGGGMMAGMGLPNLTEELGDILMGIKDPPPGTDEIVALAKVISYLDNGYTTPAGQQIKFDRIVLDTAPTGHTLRMLQLPVFVQKLIAKVRVLREKTKSMSGMMGMLGGGGGGGSEQDSETDMAAAMKLIEFEQRMKRLEQVLHSSKDCEFTTVTIPTQLAMAETQRLLGALQDEGILNRRLIVNQVLPIPSSDSSSDITSDDAAATAANDFLNKLRAGQQQSMSELSSLASSVDAPLIQVPYFDMEVRTVYGLRVISNAILNPEP